MREKHPLEVVHQLLADPNIDSTLTHTLCVMDKQLRLLRNAGHPTLSANICSISPREHHLGFSQAKWNSIEHQLRILKSKGQLCLPPQEPSQPPRPTPYSSSSPNTDPAPPRPG